MTSQCIASASPSTCVATAETQVESAAEPAAERTFWRALLHRWFVEYNPLALGSAALVLSGLWIMSRDLPFLEGATGPFSIAAISEFYAWSLIGGAAFMFRIRMIRSAVILALLAAVFQCDVLLHSESCAFLGGPGWLGAGVWWTSFFGKLFALERALQLRLSRSARAVPLLGALSIFFPLLIRSMDITARTVLVCLWLSAIFTMGFLTSRTARSCLPLDVRGRRALEGVWVLWSVALVLHAFRWTTFGVSSVTLALSLALVSSLWFRREVLVWMTMLIALVAGMLLDESFFPLLALIATGTLFVRALRQRAPRTQWAPESRPPSYRQSAAPPSSMTFLDGPRLVTPARREQSRALAGSLFTFYLFVASRFGDPFSHVLAIDLLLWLTAATITWKLRRPEMLLPPLCSGAHLLYVSTAVPTSSLGLGGLIVGVGFGSLLLSMGLAYWSSSERRVFGTLRSKDMRERRGELLGAVGLAKER